MSENTKKSGVPVTSVIYLILITALSVAVVMLLLERKTYPSSAPSSTDAQPIAETVEKAVRKNMDEKNNITQIEKAVQKDEDEKSNIVQIENTTDNFVIPVAKEENSENVTKQASETNKSLSASGYVDPMKACLMIKALGGSGSGFKVKHAGKVYVITCAHVINNEPILIIKDIDNREYKVKRTLVAKDRDLAVIEIDVPDDEANCLPLHPSISDLTYYPEVVCYGDPEGMSVIDHCEGKIMCIGTSSVEVDAPFIRGYSGGPVVLKGTNLVVGVASLLKKTSETEKWLIQGSRFEYETRRFSVRADNLDWSDLEEKDFGTIDKNDFESLNKIANQAAEEGDLKKAFDLLIYLAQNGDKNALNQWCDIAFLLLFVEKDPYALESRYSDFFTLMKKAAEIGLSSGILNLGICYLFGIGTFADLPEGFARIEEAAKLGDARAYYVEGLCYLEGIGTDKNTNKAINSFEKGAEKEEVNCMKALGSYHLGENRPFDAVKWYRKAAGKNDAEAIFMLGRMYDSGEGVPKDSKVALEHYQRSAKMGCASAQTMMGDLYDQMGNYTSAIYWYNQAATKLDVDAIKKLGDYHLTGQGGLPADPDLALLYFALAAQGGQVDAMMILGAFFNKVKNYAYALGWYQKAAAQGNAMAFYLLGVMNDNGEGVEKDPFIAFEYYKKAAELGCQEAWCPLGFDYFSGKGTLVNRSEGLCWLRKAADIDEPFAQRIIGDCYYYGWEVPINKNTAIYWYERAAKAGDEEAKKKLMYIRNNNPRPVSNVGNANVNIQIIGPARVKVGDVFQYTVTINNVGPGTAKGVVVTEILPYGVILVSDRDARTFTMTAGDMIPGCIKTATFEAVATARGTACNYAYAKWNNFNNAYSSVCTKVE